MSWSEPGFGFFGKGFWGRRVLWDNVPIQQRELDAYGYLEQLLGIYGDELEAFLGAISLLPVQRDPYEARADGTESEWFYVGAVLPWASDVWGSVTRLIGEADFAQMPNTGDPLVAPVGPADRYPWYPYEPISSTARWWRTVIQAVDDATGAEDPAEYQVALVRTRNFDQASIYAASRSLANEVWVGGGELALPFQRPAGWVVTGNAATDAGAFGSGVPVGRGDGTAVPPVTLPGPLVRLRPNSTTDTTAGAALVLDILTDAGPLRLYDAPDPAPAVEQGTLYREDPLNLGFLDLANPLGTVDYLGGTVVPALDLLGVYSVYDVPMTAHWLARGYYLQFRPPRVLDHLARDYGFDNDRNDPEDRQRAAIAHLWQYFGCKGAQEAYRIRGEISLFDVFVQGLWHICDYDLAMMLPSSHVFEYGGTWYTDLAPRSLRFDDIRGDEQYFDTFNHDPLFPSPAWLTLADRAYMYEDAAMGDGMSVGLAFALDVTQGFYGQVSEINANPRPPAIIIAADALSATEAASMNLAAGFRVTVEMLRCQAEAFSFRRGNFGLTVYEHGVTPPALDDQVYWIDYEEAAWTLTMAGPTPEEDVGRWTVIVGTGVGATVPGPGEHVAVRYWPEVDKGDCCYCRSYRARVLIEPKAQAYDHYATDAEMQAAIVRLRDKITDKLLPIHVRVAEWVVTTEWDLTMLDILGGRTSEKVLSDDEFMALGLSGQVLVTVEQRGDLSLPGQTQTMAMLDAAGNPLAPVVNTGAQQSGFADPTTWYPIAGWVERDITTSVDGIAVVRVRSTAAAPVTYGDVRWTFRVTRSTLG